MKQNAPDSVIVQHPCYSEDENSHAAREGNVLLPENCETMSGDQFAAFMDLQEDGSSAGR